jgi:hypothetical protein
VLRAGLALLVALIAAVPGTATAAPRDERLRDVRDFAFAIGSGALAKPLGAYDLVVVDGVEASRRRVAQLRRRGAVVLAYLSVGTIERGRPWSRAAARYRLDRLEEWDEWYADVNARGYRRLLAARVAPSLLRKGFDGLFLDNTDMVETHRGRRPGMRALVRSLARRRGLLFTQNGETSIGGMLRFYDGWNREDLTYTYDFDRSRYVAQPAAQTRAAQRALRRIARAGLLVTATDYLPDDAPAADVSAAASNACAAGALPFVSDIGLTRVPADPLHC